MEAKNFIDNLSQRNADYNNPEQAISQAGSLELLSRDIYTDDKRFIYELLQNADDASNESGSLDVKIDFVSNYIIISHKGMPFSQVDIKSLASSGDGNKTGDDNKTGFKGIGFKSVFAHSNLVIIKSGDYCFKFDKGEFTENYWRLLWGDKEQWLNVRKNDRKEESVKMPWQIIPIWTELPNELKNLSVFQEYSVSTIIYYDKIEQLKKALNDLFSESQIVLFLRSKQVKVSINTNEKLVLEKSTSNEITILKCNETILSEWLIKTEQFDIPSDIKKIITTDTTMPKKLREAEKSEISFAIQIEKGKLKPVDKENRLIFTYLPTSINYDLPFLVNASFLTDAGRQSLHQDTFWNQWLFGQVAIKYFAWIAELANKNSKYCKQILSVIPDKLNSSEKLKSCFDNGLLQDEYSGKDWEFKGGFDAAIENIAFIPNLNGDLRKVKETIFDKTNISQCINSQTLINYINESRKKIFLVSSYIPYLEPISTLSRLGTEIFDIQDLEGFFASSTFTNEHKLSENFNLISFLYEQVQRIYKEESKNKWNGILRKIPFIFDKNEQLTEPTHIYFPAVEFTNEFSDEISIIHESIVSKINTDSRIKTWLENLGVQEPSDSSFIEKTIIEQGDTFVTTENAIEIGRYLFNAHKKGKLEPQHYQKLQHLNILTKQNSLISASKSFLSDFYEPDLKIENIYNEDIFVSEKYFESKDLKREWNTFFTEIGVDQGIKWKSMRINRSLLESKYNDYYRLLPSGSPHTHTTANSKITFPNDFREYELNQISLIEHATDFSFSKVFWRYLFQWEISLKTNRSDYGMYCVRAWNDGYNKYQLPVLFNDWFIENYSIFPTTQKTCLKVSEVYSNAITEILEIAGNHLPVFDYDGAIPPDWKNYLKFIKKLTVDDYLLILNRIWSENSQDEQLQKENQKRIGLIYEKLALENFHSSESERIKQWATSNKLLAKNGTDFYYPKDLQLVRISGFNENTLAFADEKNEHIVELLRLFGVSIIDKVTKHIPNSKVEIKDLKHKLLQVSPLIALVAVEKSKNRKDWETEFSRITNKLSAICFFQTSEIYLSYGDNEGKQKRSSWAEENEFYYVGKWYSPRVLDGLIEPLGKFLNIRYAERILTVLLLETFAGGIEYLKEKSLDISLIPDELLNSKEPETNTNNQNNRDYNQSDEDLGRAGELFIYGELKRIYTQKYGQPIEETKTGFKIGSNVEVFWVNIFKESFENHDFKVVELNKEIYIDSKATPYGKNVEKVALYISGNELDLMERAEKYLIARVYNATSENATIEFVRLQIDDITS